MKRMIEITIILFILITTNGCRILPTEANYAKYRKQFLGSIDPNGFLRACRLLMDQGIDKYDVDCIDEHRLHELKQMTRAYYERNPYVSEKAWKYPERERHSPPTEETKQTYTNFYLVVFGKNVRIRGMQDIFFSLPRGEFDLSIPDEIARLEPARIFITANVVLVDLFGVWKRVGLIAHRGNA